MEIERTSAEIEEVICKCIEQAEKGESIFFGMSYEDGVRATLDWILGECDENPMED